MSKVIGEYIVNFTTIKLILNNFFKKMTQNNNQKIHLNKGMIATILLIGLMFFSIVWSIDGPEKLLKSILSANPLWLILAMLIFLGSWLAESLVLHVLI